MILGLSTQTWIIVTVVLFVIVAILATWAGKLLVKQMNESKSREGRPGHDPHHAHEEPAPPKAKSHGSGHGGGHGHSRPMSLMTKRVLIVLTIVLVVIPIIQSLWIIRNDPVGAVKEIVGSFAPAEPARQGERKLAHGVNRIEALEGENYFTLASASQTARISLPLYRYDSPGILRSGNVYIRRNGWEEFRLFPKDAPDALGTNVTWIEIKSAEEHPVEVSIPINRKRS